MTIEIFRGGVDVEKIFSSGGSITQTNKMPTDANLTAASISIGTLTDIQKVNGATVGLNNPLPTGFAQSGAYVSDTNPLSIVPMVGGSSVRAANPMPQNIYQGGALMSDTNPLPSVPFVGGSSVRSANPLPQQMWADGVSKGTVANPVPQNILVAGVSVATTSPFPQQIWADGVSRGGTTNPFGSNVYQQGAQSHPTNPLYVAMAFTGTSVQRNNPFPVQTENNALHNYTPALAAAASKIIIASAVEFESVVIGRASAATGILIFMDSTTSVAASRFMIIDTVAIRNLQINARMANGLTVLASGVSTLELTIFYTNP